MGKALQVIEEDINKEKLVNRVKLRMVLLRSDHEVVSALNAVRSD